MVVKSAVNPDTPLTPEEIAIIEAAKKMPFVYDEDCPPMTGEQLRQFKPVNPLFDGSKPKPNYG